MKSAVIVFPGSNCDRDVYTVMQARGLEPQMVWHANAELPAGLDLVVIPGGFSYGDYLRCGAMAAHSPIMQSVRKFAEGGGLTLGICNGFQILCEMHLLPGALMMNDHLRFNCKPVHLRVESTDSPFTSKYEEGEVVSMPIAHAEGNYFADGETLKLLEDEGRIAFRYTRADGEIASDANPNGAARNIAGIFNERRNVLGMMPHPERHADPLTGGTDGIRVFESLFFAH